MATRYWQIKGDPEERRFCFTTEASFTCPHAYFERERENGEVVRRIPTPAAEAVAQVLGGDVDSAMRLLERGHGSGRGTERRREKGKLTDRCAVCGAKMVAHGYSAYVERPKREDEFHEGDRTSAAIAGRLGFDGPMVRVRSQSGLKRSEARAWAWEQRQMAAAQLEEAKR
jgi:hypothetical protein